MKIEFEGEWEVISKFRYEYATWHVDTIYEPHTPVIFITSYTGANYRLKIDGIKYKVAFVGVHGAVLQSIDGEWQIELKRCGTEYVNMLTQSGRCR